MQLWTFVISGAIFNIRKNHDRKGRLDDIYLIKSYNLSSFWKAGNPHEERTCIPKYIKQNTFFSPGLSMTSLYQSVGFFRCLKTRQVDWIVCHHG